MTVLADIAEINPRLNSKPDTDETISFLGMADVSEEGQTSLGTNRPYGEVQKGFTPFLNGDLLMAKITPCFENGKIAQAALANKSGFGSTEFHVIRVNGELADSRYVLHMLRSPRVRLAGGMRMTGSAGQKRVPREFLETLEIPLPPLPEQRRIAQILDRADALRVKRRQALTFLDEFSDSLFLSMFGDPLANANRSDATSLESVSRAIIDCPHSTPIWTDEGLTCVRTSNLTEGGWDMSEERFVSAETHLERTKRGRLSEGDIILSREGTIGVAAIVPQNIEMSMGQRLVQIQPDRSFILSEFLLAYLLKALQPSRLSRLLVGSTSRHLNVRDIRELKILVPSLPQQEAFDETMRGVRRQRDRLVHSLSMLNELFSSLQYHAFSGQL